MSDLTAEVRAALPDDARMDAYYYGFDRTGIAVVDAILSAVAVAGKGSHHTDGWTSNPGYDYYKGRPGLPDADCGADLIQATADRSAALILALCDRLDAAEAKPSREDVARVIVNHSGHLGTHYMDMALAAADAVLALLPGRTVEETYHDEYTLAKVYWSLGRCGLGDVQITDAVNEMQNAGILFRERGEPNV